MAMYNDTKVWYYPVLGDKKSGRFSGQRFAGVIVAEGGLENTYRVRMVAEYFAWISEDALLRRPSQEAPCLAETNLCLREEECQEIDSGAPLVRYGDVVKTFRETLDKHYNVSAMATLMSAAGALAHAVALKENAVVQHVLDEANKVLPKVHLDGIRLFTDLVKSLGGARVGDTWVYPAPAEEAAPDSSVPRARYSLCSHGMTRCQSDDDGHCVWKHCPQLRDGEPAKSRRHCPLDRPPEDDDDD